MRHQRPFRHRHRHRPNRHARKWVKMHLRRIGFRATKTPPGFCVYGKVPYQPV